MQESLDEMRELRATLLESSAQNKLLVTQTRILREHCFEVRKACQQASKEMVRMVRHTSQQLHELDESLA